MKCVIHESIVVRGHFAFVIILLFVVVGIYGALEPVNNEEAGSSSCSQEGDIVSKRNSYAVASARNLSSTSTIKMEDGDDYDDYGGNGRGDNGPGNDNNVGDGSMDRIGEGSLPCTKDNILVFQGATSPMPNGIPTYTVEIQNVCMSESCSISNIHLTCGWFSSARLINPRIFRRIGYDDCLVNDGEAINPGEALSFQYANTFKYPLSVSSVAC